MFLLYAIERSPSFKSVEEYRRAWGAHRTELLISRPPFQRPHAYWDIEADYIPQHNENEREVLMRLGLPLRPDEKRILADERAARTDVA